MPTYFVPVAVIAESGEDAERYVEGLLKGRKPAELPEAQFDWVGDAEIQHAPEGDPLFGEIELTPFRPDGDTGEYPTGTLRLDALEDGALFEDADGRLFNVVSQGPTQGSTEIVDDDEVHAYYDCGTRVRRHGWEAEQRSKLRTVECGCEPPAMVKDDGTCSGCGAQVVQEAT